jgi:hypothetical protein
LTPRAIAKIKRESAEESKNYDFSVRQHYKLMPTDERFLQMTQEQIVREFWRIYYFELRKTPSKEGGQETEYEAGESFYEEMEKAGLVQTPEGRWVEIDPDSVEDDIMREEA